MPSPADDLRALLAMEGGRETLKARSRWMEAHGPAVLALLDGAQAATKYPITPSTHRAISLTKLAAAVAALTEPRP